MASSGEEFDSAIFDWLPKFGEKSEGNIFAGHESVHTPAKIALKMEAPTSTSAPTPLYPDASMIQPKQRPCLIMPGSVKESEMTVCVMATFGGHPTSTLAEVFQHFILPIHPHTPSLDTSYFLRTTEPWPPNCWVIAYPFTPRQELLDQWHIGPNRTVPAQVTMRELTDFDAMCRKKTSEWDLNMESNEFVGTVQKNYHASTKTEARQRAQDQVQASQTMGSSPMPLSTHLVNLSTLSKQTPGTGKGSLTTDKSSIPPYSSNHRRANFRASQARGTSAPSSRRQSPLATREGSQLRVTAPHSEPKTPPKSAPTLRLDDEIEFPPLGASVTGSMGVGHRATTSAKPECSQPGQSSESRQDPMSASVDTMRQSEAGPTDTANLGHIFGTPPSTDTGDVQGPVFSRKRKEKKSEVFLPKKGKKVV